MIARGSYIKQGSHQNIFSSYLLNILDLIVLCSCSGLENKRTNARGWWSGVEWSEVVRSGWNEEKACKFK
jgi:hypothetical protein